MPLSRLFGLLGALALLGTGAPAAHAAPLDTHRNPPAEQRWQRYRSSHWDASQPWFQRVVVVVPPTDGLAQPVTVRVVVPAPAVATFAVPVVVTTLQQSILPVLVAAVPTPPFPLARLTLVQVAPQLFVLVHPALFWGPDDAWAGYEFAAWLAASAPGFQLYFFNGPQGYGIYLAYALQ
jgi:hypothetical protein